MNISKITFLAIAIAFTALVSSCKKDTKKDDPEPDIENEIITTIQIEFKDSLTNAVSTYKWENLGGFGLGTVTTIDTVRLTPSTKYFATILLLNKTNPAEVDTISNEVAELSNEHQFFFSSTTNISSSYLATDVDINNVPLGLFPRFVTGLVGKGDLEILLKHQPNVKPKSGQGDKNQGSTDLNVSFPVIIK
jgi:hypothetical protein